MERVPMTPEGHAALTTELKHILEVMRPGIVRDIEEARAHGDISENSEYEDAKHRQSLCEARMIDLKSKIARAEVIRIADMPHSERIVFGTTVHLEDLDSGEKVVYRIVGVDEADVGQGRISFSSPLGKAMIGRSVDDEIVVETPRGRRTVVVVAVEYK